MISQQMRKKYYKKPILYNPGFRHNKVYGTVIDGNKNKWLGA